MNTPDILKQILSYQMRLIILYDGEEIIGEAPFTDNLDKTTPLRSFTGSPGCHMGVGKLDDGRYYVCYSSDFPEGIVRRKKEDGTFEILYRREDDFGPPYLGEIVSEEKAKDIVMKYNEDKYKEIFGHSINEQGPHDD
jgi:hypothetical protein